ncbi:titin-like isoform X4 [Trichomycterus rosablanca]|uniref:titin-like isoform X4 n=1 Tax=Trichomycterus rosablanca TaxID=2290929 RepID=UPI002F35A585
MACLLRFWSRLRTPRPGDPEHPEVEKNQPGKPKKDGKRWKLKSLRKIFRRKKKVTGEGEEAAAAEDHRSLIQPEHEADDAHQGTGNLEVETHDEVVKGLDGSRDHLLEYETLKVLETKSEHLRKRIKFLLEKNEKQIELKSVRAEVETLQKKKRVRRGTRGRGRKIHYRKREEEEPETGDVRQPQTGEAGEETQQVMKVEEEKKVMDVVMETEEAEAEACYEQPLAEESRVKFLDEAKDESLQKKKRVRRGTRGRGRKIHYRKREEEEPETGDVRQPQTGEAGEETQQIMKVEEEKKVMDMVMETEEAEAEACYEQPLEESRVKLLDEAKDESLQKKKRVRRGTRGRGRKIHYRKREEEEPETGDVRQPQTGEAGEETQQIMKVEEEKKVMDVVMETEEAEACYEQPLAEESRVKFLDEAKDEGLQKKKKVKRGTRGRGQKIHYRKREEEEPETGDVRQPQTGEAGEKTQQIMKVEEEKKVMDVVMETEEAEACYEQPLAEAKTTYWYGAGTNHWYHQHYQQPYYQQPPPATYWYGQIDTGAGTNHWCHQYYQQPYYQQPPPATYWYGQMDTGKGTTYWYNHDQQHPQATYWYGPENSGNQWCQW